MKKTLAALAFGVSLLANPNAALSDGDYNPSKKLHEILKPFLDERGLVRDSYRTNHYFALDDERVPHYMKHYNLVGVSLVETYDLKETKGVNEPDSINTFQEFPSRFLFGGIIGFIDPNLDGFNGNEKPAEVSSETEEESFFRLLKTRYQ